jgi:hypothetical protein
VAVCKACLAKMGELAAHKPAEKRVAE